MLRQAVEPGVEAGQRGHPLPLWAGHERDLTNAAAATGGAETGVGSSVVWVGKSYLNKKWAAGIGP